MSFRVTGLNELVRWMNTFSQQLPSAGKASQKTSANAGITGAKNKVHKISRNLENSIRVLGETPESISFGSNLSYAAREEFRVGGRQGDHAYMRPQYNYLQTFYPEQFIIQLRRIF